MNRVDSKASQVCIKAVFLGTAEAVTLLGIVALSGLAANRIHPTSISKEIVRFFTTSSALLYTTGGSLLGGLILVNGVWLWQKSKPEAGGDNDLSSSGTDLSSSEYSQLQGISSSGDLVSDISSASDTNLNSQLDDLSQEQVVKDSSPDSDAPAKWNAEVELEQLGFDQKERQVLLALIERLALKEVPQEILDIKDIRDELYVLNSQLKNSVFKAGFWSRESLSEIIEILKSRRLIAQRGKLCDTLGFAPMEKGVILRFLKEKGPAKLKEVRVWLTPIKRYRDELEKFQKGSGAKLFKGRFWSRSPSLRKVCQRFEMVKVARQKKLIQQHCKKLDLSAEELVKRFKQQSAHSR